MEKLLRLIILDISNQYKSIKDIGQIKSVIAD